MSVTLSEKQKAELALREKDWDKIALCTEPADRPRAERHITALYRIAGAKKPAFEWSLSPVLAYKTISKRNYEGAWFWGQHDIAWVGFYQFCSEIGVPFTDQMKEAIGHWVEVSKSCMWFWPFEDLCVVCDRPAHQSLDAESRLHGEDGPCFEDRSGWQRYAWHGVIVPPKVILHADELSPAEIDGESNQEVRRVMVERFGRDRYLMEGGAKLVHEDEWGKLWRRDVAFDNPREPLLMVQVKNSTPEGAWEYTGAVVEKDGVMIREKRFVPKLNEDGEIYFKDYFLRVAPTIRPMTARAAVASTFQMTPQTYAPQEQS